MGYDVEGSFALGMYNTLLSCVRKQLLAEVCMRAEGKVSHGTWGTDTRRTPRRTQSFEYSTSLGKNVPDFSTRAARVEIGILATQNHTFLRDIYFSCPSSFFSRLRMWQTCMGKKLGTRSCTLEYISAGNSSAHRSDT
jgi:hypothetical protein